MRNRIALVRIDGQPAGLLTESELGYEFSYSAQWLANPMATPISPTMPLRAQPYLSQSLYPFFQNLLPEGWLLELATKKLKVSKDDAFGLLIATCADCIGVAEELPYDSQVEA